MGSTIGGYSIICLEDPNRLLTLRAAWNSGHHPIAMASAPRSDRDLKPAFTRTGSRSLQNAGWLLRLFHHFDAIDTRHLLM